MNRVIAGFLFAAFFMDGDAQQVNDNSFSPKNTTVSFSRVAAPRVFIDEAHHNMHTKDGGYKSFAAVLKSDGYSVQANLAAFSKDSLQDVDVLVIANALSEKNLEIYDLPNYSAFTRDEQEAVQAWVKEGGSLFLIADHLPFPKASADLAAMFGFHFNNGYAMDEGARRTIFSAEKGSLRDHPILKGRRGAEKVDAVRTFTGQAFLPPPVAHSLLTFEETAKTHMPQKHWEIDENTPSFPIGGWSQGATLKFGKGRVAVFGEAAMFTAQYIEEDDLWFGMTSEGAEQNEQFLLNVMHWLSGLID